MALTGLLEAAKNFLVTFDEAPSPQSMVGIITLTMYCPLFNLHASLDAPVPLIAIRLVAF